jgi:hypothetical protein
MSRKKDVMRENKNSGVHPPVRPKILLFALFPVFSKIFHPFHDLIQWRAQQESHQQSQYQEFFPANRDHGSASQCGKQERYQSAQKLFIHRSLQFAQQCNCIRNTIAFIISTSAS